MEGGRVKDLVLSEPKRAEYRKRIDEHHREFMENTGGDAVATAIGYANAEFGKMELVTGRETVKDALFVKSIAMRVRQNANKVTFNRQQFATPEYAINLTKVMAPELSPTDAIGLSSWQKLGDLCQHFFQKPVHGRFLRFPENAPQPPPQPRRTRAAPSKRRAADRSLVQPASCRTKMEKLDASSSAAASKRDDDDEVMEPRLKRIEESLVREFRKNQNRPLPYHRFALDPRSFEASVRNIFHLSFVIKNRKAVVFFRGDQPFIYPKKEERRLRDDVGRNGYVDAGSWIVSISKAMWKELVESHQVEEAAI